MVNRHAHEDFRLLQTVSTFDTVTLKQLIYNDTRDLIVFTITQTISYLEGLGTAVIEYEITNYWLQQKYIIEW